MIIKPPLKPDSLKVIFNGNYDIEEKNKYEIASELKRIDIEIKSGDANKIINKIINHHNITSIEKLTLRYGANKHVIFDYNNEVIIKQINIKYDYADTVDINAKGSAINLGDEYVGKLKVLCGKLITRVMPSISIEASCKSVNIVAHASSTTCNFNNIITNLFDFRLYRTDRDATYKLVFANCNIKKCDTNLAWDKYDIMATDSNIRTWHIIVNSTTAKFNINSTNNIIFDITSYDKSNLTFDGESKYTIGNVSLIYGNILNISHKDQVIFAKKVVLTGITLKNIDYPDKAIASFVNVLLKNFDEEYSGEDFIEQINEAINNKLYISVANLAKASKLIKSKTKMTKLYKLTHIFTESWPDMNVKINGGGTHAYTSDEIIEVFDYTNKHGIIDGLLLNNSSDIIHILEASNIPKWLTDKCYELKINLNTIFSLKSIISSVSSVSSEKMISFDIINGYYKAVKRNLYTVTDFNEATKDERIEMMFRIVNQEFLEDKDTYEAAMYVAKQLKLTKQEVKQTENYFRQSYRKYHTDIAILAMYELPVDEKVDLLLDINFTGKYIPSASNIDFVEGSSNNELNKKICILKILTKDESAFTEFFNMRVYSSDAYINYKYKGDIDKILLSRLEVIKTLNRLNNTEINKIIGYDPSKYADLNYGSPMVNQLLLMERRKIKNNIIYRKLPRNINTIYLDTVNELKSSYNKNSNEYNELKWIENNIDINGASGDDLSNIDEYLVSASQPHEGTDKEQIYKLITNIKKSYIEEKNIVINSQSLIGKQNVLRMNLKNMPELNSMMDKEDINSVDGYMNRETIHPINKAHLTLVWIRFNIDDINKSIWINEIQTDMTKILMFGERINGKFIPTELGNKLNDKLSYLIIYQFQFWVVKHYSDYTVILPSYTTRKKLLNGEPSINGYDNPAKKLKFTKGEYKDTPWYNVKKGDGLVWIWSPLTESRQL